MRKEDAVHYTNYDLFGGIGLFDDHTTKLTPEVGEVGSPSAEQMHGQHSQVNQVKHIDQSEYDSGGYDQDYDEYEQSPVDHSGWRKQKSWQSFGQNWTSQFWHMPSEDNWARGQQWLCIDPNRVYQGVVTRYSSARKSGFISCSEITRSLGVDVYVFKDVLIRGRAGIGDTVGFKVHWSAKGQPQASSPLVRLSTTNGKALVGVYKQGGAFKRFGFIECTELQPIFFRDVYVQKECTVGLNHGDHVAFNAQLNREGLPHVRDVEVVGELFIAEPTELSGADERCGPPSSGPPDNIFSSPKGKGSVPHGTEKEIVHHSNKSGKGWKGYAFEKASVIFSAGPPVPTGERFFGVVKSFHQLNNYGFIVCSEVYNRYGRDVFVHGRQCSEDAANWLQIGTTVSFQLALNSQGCPQALEVRPVNPIEADAATMPSSTLVVVDATSNQGAEG